MKTRCFEYKDGRSKKFWNITINESQSRFTTHWGAIGTTGAKKEKLCYTKVDLEREVDKIIRSKLAKGYKEVKPTINEEKKVVNNSSYLELL